MLKTVTALYYKRPDIVKQQIQYLMNLWGKENWKFYAFCDDPGHDEVYNLVRSYEFFDFVYKFPQHMGLKGASLSVFDLIYDSFIKSDFNIHIEEDILPGPDTLLFADWCLENFTDKVQSFTLFSHPMKMPSNRNLVHVRKGFSCHGWGATRKFYKEAIEKSEDQGKEGWAINVFERVRELGWGEFYPERRRMKCIGWDSGVHPHDRNNLPSYAQKPEEWTGEKLESGVNDLEICCSLSSQCYNINYLNYARK